MVGLNEGSFPDFRNMDNEGIEPSNDSCMWQSPGHPEPYGCGARECDAFGTWYQDAAAPTLINLLCRGHLWVPSRRTGDSVCGPQGYSVVKERLPSASDWRREGEHRSLAAEPTLRQSLLSESSLDSLHQRRKLRMFLTARLTASCPGTS